MKLYSGPLSMFGAKAEIALHEKGIAFDLEMVPFEMKTLYQPKHPEVARIKADKKMIPAQVSLIKRHNVRAALEIARTCRDILGGNGITLEYPVMRHMCNLETVFTYEGTHDVHTLVLGQHVTGIPAFE